MMAIRLLKLTLLLTLVFAACIGLIRAQPYDDSELRAFLTPPDGCPMPCFMGIRPGVTTADEAVAILEVHEWVGQVNPHASPISGQTDYIEWSWNTPPPDTIGSNYPTTAYIRDNVVNQIYLQTLVSLGDIWLTWGTPDEFAFTTVPVQLDVNDPIQLYVVYLNVFSEENFLVISDTICPYVPAFWHSQVDLYTGNMQNSPLPDLHYYSSTSNPFLDFAIDLQHSEC